MSQQGVALLGCWTMDAGNNMLSKITIHCLQYTL